MVSEHLFLQARLEHQEPQMLQEPPLFRERVDIRLKAGCQEKPICKHLDHSRARVAAAAAAGFLTRKPLSMAQEQALVGLGMMEQFPAEAHTEDLVSLVVLDLLVPSMER